MIFVVDILYIKKRIQNKYNKIILDYKLSQLKLYKILVTVVILGIIILEVSTIKATGVIDHAQYSYLLDHYVNNLKYPKALAERLINSLTITDFQELYQRVSQHDKFMDNGGKQLLNIGNEFGSRIVKWIKALLTLYN